MVAPPNLRLTAAMLTGESLPEHEFPGRVLILVIRVFIPAGLVAWQVLEPWPLHALPVVARFGVIFFVLGVFLAESLRRFECWAWF